MFKNSSGMFQEFTYYAFTGSGTSPRLGDATSCMSTLTGSGVPFASPFGNFVGEERHFIRSSV